MGRRILFHMASALERLRDLYRSREVIRNFVSRDLKVRYRRSVLGFLWSLLNPLLHMVVLAVVFGMILGRRFPGGGNYAFFLFSSLIPWQFFSSSLSACTTSIITAEHFIKSQAFPKLIFPLCAVLQNLVNTVLSFVVLFFLMGAVAGFGPQGLTPALAVLPLSLFLLFLFTLGIGALSALATLYFRDLTHLVGHVVMALFYVTPILYPLDAPPGVQPLIPAEYHIYFKLNPLYSVIAMFNKPIYYGVIPPPAEMAAAAGISAAFAVIGLLVFWRFEDDIVFRL